MRTFPLMLGAILLTSAVLGCGLFGDQSSDPPEPAVDLFFKADVNGEPWQGYQSFFLVANVSHSALGRYFNIGAAYADSSAYPYYQRIGLNVESDSIRANNYSITRHTYNNTQGVRTGGYLRELDGDALIARHTATTDTSNYLEITQYDSTTGIAEGTFAVTFAKGEEYRNRPRSRFPDTLRFTDGEFRVRPAIYDNTNTCLRFCEAPDPAPDN